MPNDDQLPINDVIVCAKAWLVEEDAALLEQPWVTQEPDGTIREFATSRAAFRFRHRWLQNHGIYPA